MKSALHLGLALTCVALLGACAMEPGREEAAPPPPAFDATLSVGSGRFVMPFVAAGVRREIPVWYHRPSTAPADAPIVFVMHGRSRAAENYRKNWIPLAEAGRYILLVPEFRAGDFPGDYYSGYTVDAQGHRFPEAQWTFSAVERVFDAVRAANGFTSPTYDIYGHSGGAQFVHRLAFQLPKARYRVAVVANAGWYTLPDFEIEWPYGLKGSGVDRAMLAQVLGRRIVVLLGDADTDPNHPDLRRSPEADAQGPHRLARGGNFFDRARQAAALQGVPFGWVLRTVPGVAHSNGRMAPHAAQFVGKRD